MLIRSATPTSCFGLSGCNENAGTAAFGWCIDRCVTLRAAFLELVGLDPGLEIVVSSQVFAEDRGFTDLEFNVGTTLHFIFEAKLGWRVTTSGQLQRYLPRLLKSAALDKRLFSISAADKPWASRHLPTELEGVPVHHLSWSDLQALTKKALETSRSSTERVWLWELHEHLKEYGMASNVFDSRAYVVSLNSERVRPDNPLTWIDVTLEQKRYFHPVGGNGRGGWPAIPPAYIGFRYMSEFRSAHFIEHVEITDRIQDVDPRWPDSDSPHFIYHLGPAMKPVRPMPLGTIHPSMRNYVALDLLLSGVASDYKNAIDLMKLRKERQG